MDEFNIYDKSKYVVFEFDRKFYFTRYDNYYRYVLDLLKCTEMTGFNSLEECKKYLEENFGCEVKIEN